MRKVLFFLVGGWVALTEPARVVAAEVLSAGIYETHGANATLSVTVNADKTRSFQIKSVGANGHQCWLTGKVQGLTGHTTTDATSAADAACQISFKPTANSITVSAITQDACRNFCGLRASFEDDYFLPPAGCAATQRSARRQTFLTLSKAQRYTDALGELTALYAQCHDFLNWIAIDEVRNDIAITQWHLGNKSACRAVLADALGAQQLDEDALRSTLPPSDFESYLPVAQATWHNLKRCAQ